jgi:hypothetical protein
MFNRKHIAIIALAAASVSTGALATGDAGVRPAERLLQEARGFGAPNVTGQAAGDRRDAHRAARVDDENLNRSERLWREMGRKGSEGN